MSAVKRVGDWFFKVKGLNLRVCGFWKGVCHLGCILGSGSRMHGLYFRVWCIMFVVVGTDSVILDVDGGQGLGCMVYNF